MMQIPVEAPLTEYFHRKAAYYEVPFNGTFELTPCCNMSCKMCYVRMTKEEQQAKAPLRTAKEWLELGAKAKAQGMFYLLLTGGEPFLRPDFREILEGLHHMGLIISINSNGTLIDETVMEWLRKTPPVRINITLYGASDETYARLCGNPHGFTQVTKAIRMLKAAGITVKINCSVTPYNVCDLEKIFAFVKEEGLLIQATSYMFPPLRRDENMIGCNDRFSAEKAAYYAACIGCMANGEDYFLKNVTNHTAPFLSMDTNEDCPKVSEGDGIRCRAGKCSFWVTWDGKMLPCGMFPTQQAPNVFSVDFVKAWEQTKQFVKEIKLPVACANCQLKEACKPCAAMVYTESGNFHKVPEYRCQMTKHYYDACQMVEKEIRNKRGEGK